MGVGERLIRVSVSCIIVVNICATTKALAYDSYVFTIEDIIVFSYKDDTELQLYDSNGTLIQIDGSNSITLDKGEHSLIDSEVSQGVYKISGSDKFSVLMGDANTAGVSGYYAMDANGLGVSTEFYTYVPQDKWPDNDKFIIFGYHDDTEVTVQRQEPNGTYVNIDEPFDLNDGEHRAFTGLDEKYIHVTADKPVSALTCYDQGYFVPSAEGGWSGTKFHTYVSDIGPPWPEDLTVIAYDDDTTVNIKDSNTGASIWSGTLNGGEPCVLSYPDGADQYFTITSDKTVTVSVQPWVVQTKNYSQGVFVPDRDGTGIGRMGRSFVSIAKSVGTSMGTGTGLSRKIFAPYSFPQLLKRSLVQQVTT